MSKDSNGGGSATCYREHSDARKERVKMLKKVLRLIKNTEDGDLDFIVYKLEAMLEKMKEKK